MRFTDSLIGEGHKLKESLNILCLKIMSSDVGFPINVYGSVIIRDALDFKCNYIFRRDRDKCQLVETQGDSLILTGPSRGVLFLGDVFFEIDLKIREEGEEKDDRKFSKTFVDMNEEKIKNLVERKTVVSWHSEMELVFAHVKKALEGTIEMKILSGPESFIGKITAYTTDLPSDDEMLLYEYDNGSVAGAVTVGAGTGSGYTNCFAVWLLSRQIRCWFFRIWDGSACISPHTYSFTPLIKGADSDVVPCGLYKLGVKIVWSTLWYRG
ncbi:hypothetical protein PR202_ga08734 [Eleusine coracana subsp. coracana]|uniref:DUF6598 domain-containing protein n=1 Tax=Eleusine coracana subsp. coracana TaxID=191504 RepID=A0AAV5C0T8_ELECO|nr:hypothetical protein PR202_ga08734 [Eleusine coracana subsp. coracana]